MSHTQPGTVAAGGGGEKQCVWNACSNSHGRSHRELLWLPHAPYTTQRSKRRIAETHALTHTHSHSQGTRNVRMYTSQLRSTVAKLPHHACPQRLLLLLNELQGGQRLLPQRGLRSTTTTTVDAVRLQQRRRHTVQRSPRIRRRQRRLRAHLRRALQRLTTEAAGAAAAAAADQRWQLAAELGVDAAEVATAAPDALRRLAQRRQPLRVRLPAGRRPTRRRRQQPLKRHVDGALAAAGRRGGVGLRRTQAALHGDGGRGGGAVARRLEGEPAEVRGQGVPHRVHGKLHVGEGKRDRPLGEVTLSHVRDLVVVVQGQQDARVRRKVTLPVVRQVRQVERVGQNHRGTLPLVDGHPQLLQALFP
eukprot:Rhum_TRINITY_DN14748_c5_g1::Rhum_TRINITY_DN14748_c5_g1_i1::g.114627::m.114627